MLTLVQEIERHTNDILERILQDIAEEVDLEDENLLADPSSAAQLVVTPVATSAPLHHLPDDLQEPDDLHTQAAFWAALVLRRGAPSPS